MTLQMSKDLAKNAKYSDTTKSNYLENRKFSLEYLEGVERSIFVGHRDSRRPTILFCWTPWLTVSNNFILLHTVTHGVQQF
jgi:hypothetical protein